MAKFGPEGLNPLVVSETDHIPERSLDVEPIDQLAHAREKQPNLLDQFTPQQQAEILRKQRILSSLAYFIGKDFNIPVELNEPGKGWHWDFKANIIRIDPIDLLEKPLDYLRFVISHEGGHRRISRTDFIPIEEWKQPGFAFMTNSIEDPRDNNFVADSYPKFQEQLALGYEWLSDLDEKTDQVAKKKLGFTPRFKRAGFEYIKQWFKERAGEEMKLSDGLPEEIKAVVLKTLESAKDSWWRYPSKEEADQSEDVIVEYAKVSYEINRDEIWPEFKKLVDSDMADEQMQEALKDAQKSAQGKGGQGGLPQKLKDKMTPQEQKDLEKAIEEAIEKAKQQAQEKEGSESAQEELSESGELGA
ncbi:MAG: hypothetical protein WCL61_02165, partial [bacterium]